MARSNTVDNTPTSSHRGTFSEDGRPSRTPRFVLGEHDHSSPNDNVNSLLKSIEEAAQRVVNGRRYAPSEDTETVASNPILGVKGDEYFEPPSPFEGEIGMVNIRRPVYSQSQFQKLFEENVEEEEKHPNQFFDSVFFADNPRRSCKTAAVGIFPFVSMLQHYQWKKYIVSDVVAGITTGITRIPQSMAYALLAHLPPSFGLYTAFFSAIVYFIFGGSHHMAAGAQGVISLMVGSGVERVAKKENMSIDTWTNSSSLSPLDDPKLQYILGIVVTITFLTGIIQVLLGAFRLGFITNYLSDPLVGGFTTGASCHVVVTQMATMLGIDEVSFTGVFNIYHYIDHLVKHSNEVNYVTMAIAFISFFLLGAIKFLNFRLKRLRKIPVPGELIVLTLAIIFSHFTQAKSKWQVKVVGDVPSGLLPPRLPQPEQMANTWDIAFTTAIVSFAIGYSIAKRFAVTHDYDISGNQEIFAFGMVNSLSSFFNCFAATASMSASSLHESLGGRSQIANLFSAALVLFALFFMGPLFYSAPHCVLASIILFNLKGILSQFKDLRPLWRLSKIDFMIWLVAWLSVMLLDVDIGLGSGVAFSLLTIVFRTQWPYTCTLGRIPSTDIYKNRAFTPNALEVPGIKIFRFEGALYFASAEHFRKSLYKETECNPIKILNERRDYEVKLIQVKREITHTLPRIASHAYDLAPADDVEESSRVHLLEQNPLLDLEKSDTHHVVIDFSTCSFIDSVGLRTLCQVLHDYRAVEITVFFANVRAAVRTMLLNIEAFDRVSAKNIYLAVHDAVLAALEDAQKMEERECLIKDAGMKSATRQVSLIASDGD